ncbi:MAG: sugar phosphate isomerase/epimerase [Gemmatimonadaceae bacterium]|nr:sugar phosphate isomerase/epimerase [Gemmatimonadaceae bacterium]
MLNDSQKAWTRRDVMRMLAAGVTGSALLPTLTRAASFAGSDESSRIERVGLQLYTVRSALSKDIEGTMAAVAKAGITEVEFFNLFGKDAAFWREQLSRNGLTAPAAHEGLPNTDDGWDPIFERANVIGHKVVFVPFVGNEYRGTRANWQRLAERLNIAASRAKAAGLEFGYHNHDFEFAAVEGTTGYDILTTETDRSLVKLELDLYWAVKAGQDPMALLKKWPGRVVAFHVKDAGPPPERAMLDVGKGTIDFKSLIAQGRKQGLRHWFIEHDNPTDPIASITASAAALKAL